MTGGKPLSSFRIQRSSFCISTPLMRRKRLRILAWSLIVGSIAMTLFGPPLGRLQATGALVVTPVSYPARGIGHWIASPLADAPPLDALSPDAPRDVRQVYEQNEMLAQQMLSLQGQLETLRAIVRDRQKLGESLLSRSAPAVVTASDGDTLFVVNHTGAPLSPGLPVLHYGSVRVGIAGIVGEVGAGGAQVHLLTHPTVRLNARFARFLEDGTLDVLDTEQPLVEGVGGGTMTIMRHRLEDLQAAGVKPGDWVIFDDPASSWPEAIRYLRIGTVAGIEEIPDAPGFARVSVAPPVDLKAIREVMIVVE